MFIRDIPIHVAGGWVHVFHRLCSALHIIYSCSLSGHLSRHLPDEYVHIHEGQGLKMARFAEPAGRGTGRPV